MNSITKLATLLAALALSFAANAADLPSNKAAPVDYVKACPTYGPGFFYIPGSDTCLKVGGAVQYHQYYMTRWTQKNDGMNSNGQLAINLDARQQTEYGVLRTFTQFTYIRSSGTDDNSNSGVRRGFWFQGNGTGYANSMTGFVPQAYVQLGGITAGYLPSFATVGQPLQNFIAKQTGGGPVGQFAYTMTLPAGMSVTAAVEDAASTYRNGIQGAAANTIPNNVPDGVVSFDVNQSWGDFKLAGVYHNVAPSGRETTADSKMGYAVLSQVKVNLPFIAAGDNITFHGAYGMGTSVRTIGNISSGTNISNTSFGIGRANTGLFDGVQTANGLVLSKSYSVGSTFQHYLTPTLSAYVSGTAGWIDYGRAASRLTTSQVRNGMEYTAETGLLWSPVKNFVINPSVAYRASRLEVADYISTNAVAEGTSSQAKKRDGAFEGRIKVTRSF